MSERFDTTVTKEELKRRDDGSIRRIELEMQKGKSAYFVHLSVEDGTVAFEKVSPVQKYGGHITGQTFSSGNVKMAHVGKTVAVLDSARQYVEDHYEDLTVRRCLWLKRHGDIHE